MKKYTSFAISVRLSNRDAARELFLSAGFSDFIEVEKPGEVITFCFPKMTPEEEARAVQTIPRDMYAYTGIVL